MTDFRTPAWFSGQGSSALADFWQVGRTRQDPEIPNLPLEDEVPRTTPVFREPQRVPVLKGRRHPQDTIVPNLLLSTLAVIASAAPFQPSEACQPGRGHRSVAVDQPPNLLLTQLFVMPGNVQFREPVLKPRRHPQDTVAPNLLLSTLSGAAPPAAPFVPADFAQPGKARRAPTFFPPPNLLTSTLALAPPGAPFGDNEAQQAPRPRRHAPADQPPNLLLTQLFVMPGNVQFREPVRVPVLKPRRHPQDTVAPNLLLSTLSGAAPPAAPFVPNDTAPVLRARRSAQAPVTNLVYEPEMNPLPVGLAAQTQPARPVRRARLEEVPNLLLGTLGPVPGPAPFRPVDLGQPAKARRAQPALELNLLTTTLAVVAAGPAPFLPADTVQPARGRRAQPFIELNLLTTTLAPAAVAAAPFVPYESAQPSRARRPGRLEEVQALYMPVYLPPGAQSFPDGVARHRVPQIPEYLPLVHSTLAPDPLPVGRAETDWQLMRRLRRYPDAFWPGINALIPNDRPPPPPPVEQPDACKYRVDLGPAVFEAGLGLAVFEVRLEPAVFTIETCSCGGGGCMVCKNENFAVKPPLIKHPSTQKVVELNFYRDCVNFRRSNEQYGLGEFVRPPIGNGYAYEVTIAGTTGERMPVLPTTEGVAVMDGSCQLTCRAAGLNAVNSLSAPTASVSPVGALTVGSVSVVEGWKIVATYDGGTLGQDYTVEFQFTLGGRSIRVSHLVQVRRT